MFEQVFKNIDDHFRKDAGCSNELDYVEQSSWILFLKYLDDLENTRTMTAELNGTGYTPIIADEYRWTAWAVPKNEDGTIDEHRLQTGNDLIDFVRSRLFPYLKGFKQDGVAFDTIQYKIGEIFGELQCKLGSGYTLRDILNEVDALHFQTSEEKHEMTHLYESRIHRMGNAGRNGGEYYTPRPLIRTMVKVVAPEIGKTVYDGACGSAGFLCEAFKYMEAEAKTIEERQTLQDSTFFGKEKKSLAYIIGIMNMILHGVEAPNLQHTNTLAENLADVRESDKFDFILANPPFGGKERAEVQQNFSIKTGETAYLFLEHFVKHLRAGGRAGIIIKNTFLSNDDTASRALRRKLLTECNLHAVLDLPGGVFTGAGVKTVVLFFEKGVPTEKVWFYQLNLERNLGKTNPLTEDDLAEFVRLYPMQAESENSWSVNVGDLNQETFDLTVKNPNKVETVIQRKPCEILDEIEDLNRQNAELLTQLRELVK